MSETTPTPSAMDMDDVPLSVVKQQQAAANASATNSDQHQPNSNGNSKPTDAAKTGSAPSDSMDDDDLPLSKLKKPVEKAKDGDEDDVPLAKMIKKRKNVVDDDDIVEAPAEKPKIMAKEPPKKATTPAKTDAKSATPAKAAADKKAPVKKAIPAKESPKPKATPDAKAKSSVKAPVKKEATTPVKKEDESAKAPPKRKSETQGKEATKKAKTRKEEEEEESSSSDSDDDSSSSSDSDSSSSSSSSSDSDDDKPLKKPTKKPAKKPVKKEIKRETKKADKKTTKPKKEKESDETDGKKRKKKEEEEVYKWWLEPPLPEGKKWKTLVHNGVMFPPPYKPHGVKMLYDGEPVELTPEQEEIATFYAQYIESPHVQKPQFKKNFFEEFLSVLNPKKKGEKHIIKKLDLCDFRPIHQHLMQQREARKSRSKEEKEKEKAENKKLEEKYGYAIVDGHKQKISNYKVEPFGLFLGRGDHPLAGTLKKKIQPEDVTLNIGKDADIPVCPVPGHKWGAIVHNDEVAWLAMWKDISGKNFKYVWLAPSSRVKGESDMKKFERARKLKDHIDDIREEYNKDMKSKDVQTRQRATALYIIDHYALRVGNEKDEDEADTVGCCSLRVEHIKLRDGDTVEFDFLGKDSMRYHNAVKVPPIVYKNFELFMEGKDEKDDLFDQLSTTFLNNFLKKKMEGLTAKVFRTYNASITLERELLKMPEEEELTVDEKMLFYNRANREVAILCNHQKTVSKNFTDQMGKIDDKIHELEEYQADLEAALKGKKRKKEKPKKEKASDDEEEKKEKEIPTDPDKIKKAISKVKEQLIKWKAKRTEKDENKSVALTTSKINYIDPRISVAWAKKHSVPIEKIFSKALRQKFPWAMDVDEDWTF